MFDRFLVRMHVLGVCIVFIVFIAFIVFTPSPLTPSPSASLWDDHFPARWPGGVTSDEQRAELFSSRMEHPCKHRSAARVRAGAHISELNIEG